jgi:Lsr2
MSERRDPVAERLVVVCDVHDTNVVATGHVRLDVAGEVHELDLCDEHLGQLRESLDTVLASTQSDRPQRAARGPGQGTRGRTGGARSATARRRRAPSRAGSGGGASGGANKSASAAHREAVREWARANGLNVSDRGRLAADVVRQFEEATGGDSASADGAGAVDGAAE